VVAIYFAAAAAAAALCSTIHYSALQLTDVSHHTVIVVGLYAVLSKSCCTIL